MISYETSCEIVSIYRGWYDISRESGVVLSKLVLIDDLAPCEIVANNYNTLSEVKKDLISVLNKVSDDNYTKIKIENSISYINSQIDKDQNNPNLKEFICSLGTKWRKPLLKEIEDIFSNINSYEAKPIESDQALGLIKKQVNEIQESLRADGLDLASFDLEFEDHKSDLPWRNIVTFEEGKFKLLVNSAQTYDEFDVISFAFHEVFGHVLHFNQIIKNDELLPHLKCISVHTLDSFYAESIAQYMYSFLVDNYFSENKMFAQAKYRFQLFFAVRHYNIVQLIEDDVSMDEVVAFHMKYLGGEAELLNGMYKSIKSNPFFCSQIMNYHEGLTILSPLLSITKERGIKIVEELLSRPLTFKQMEEYAKL